MKGGRGVDVSNGEGYGWGKRRSAWETPGRPWRGVTAEEGSSDARRYCDAGKKGSVRTRRSTGQEVGRAREGGGGGGGHTQGKRTCKIAHTERERHTHTRDTDQGFQLREGWNEQGGAQGRKARPRQGTTGARVTFEVLADESRVEALGKDDSCGACGAVLVDQHHAPAEDAVLKVSRGYKEHSGLRWSISRVR